MLVSYKFDITFKIIETFEGGARKKVFHEDDILTKKCFIRISNIDDPDKDCLTRCVAVFLGKINNDPQYETLRKSKNKECLQKIRSREIMKKCGLENGPFSFETVKHISEIMDINISVVSSEHFNNVIFKTKNENFPRMYVWLHDGHYDLITSMTALKDSHFYCDDCDNGHSMGDKHKCKVKKAFDIIKYKKDQKLKNFFKYEKLTNGNETIYITRCKNCNKNLSKENKFNHNCFMQKIPLKKSSEKYIFFDFETFMNENGEHIVNLAISKYLKEKDSDGNMIDDENFIIHNDIDEFYKWLFQPCHSGYTVIAHNGNGYDFIFILKELIKNGQGKYIRRIMNGNKIKYFKFSKLHMRFVDSYNFFMSPLSELPKIFGFKELKKGYWPHKFNKEENFNYVEKCPEIEYYEP